MPQRSTSFALAIGAALLIAGPSHAARAVYDFTGTASGDLNGTPFTGASFDIQARGDTAGVLLLPTPQFSPDTWNNYPLTLKVQLGGQGTLSVTDPGYVFDSQDVAPAQGLAGIGTIHNAASYDFLYLLGPKILKAYKLLISLAPVGGLALLANQVNPAQLDTDKGVLTFTNVQDVEFSAVVPEPATWTMMILGLGGIGAATRRRRKIGSA